MPKPSANKARLEYHLKELQIAVSPGHPNRVLPAIPNSCRSVLDVGCGLGQTLIASALPETCTAYGLEPDLEAVHFGHGLAKAKHVRFAVGVGEALPFAPTQFDFVLCRLALPYMTVPSALAEMARVLKPGGTLWLLLHSFPQIARRLRAHMAARQFAHAVFDMYVMANGALFNLTGLQVSLPLKPKRGEVFHTEWRIKRDLEALGFDGIRILLNKRGHFLTTAIKPSASEVASKTRSASGTTTYY